MSYDINLKHLEYFIKVARLGSINKAAQMLYVSQSHLGKIIHDLEETVGAPLLNRSRQGVTLTPSSSASSPGRADDPLRSRSAVPHRRGTDM